jgi:hypothetical protein
MTTKEQTTKSEEAAFWFGGRRGGEADFSTALLTKA